MLCVLLFTHPFGYQGNSDAASGGASGSVNAESFKAMAVQCVSPCWRAGGLAQGGRGQGCRKRERADLNGRVGGFAASPLDDAGQDATLYSEPFRRPTLDRVTSRYKADGSGGQREQPFPMLGVRVAWDH